VRFPWFLAGGSRPRPGAFEQAQERADLSRFLEDGRLEVDNNISERELRGPLGRKKNCRVTGSLAAADRYDGLYSALASRRLVGVDSFAWLCDVLVLVRVLTHPADRLIERAPRCGKPAE